MKRSQNSFASVVGLALFALLGLTACPQDAKEESKAPADPAVTQVHPAPTPATEGAAAATAPPAAPATGSTAAPAAGEALKADPSKAAAGEVNKAAAGDVKEAAAK